MIRAFLAFPLPEPLAHRLSVVQYRLPLPRPVPMEDFHLTLVFLDSQPEPVLEDLHYALEALSLPAPSLRLAGLGSFGGTEPETLHALVAPEPRLLALQAKLAQAARGVGIEVRARKFVPHVTLGRFRRGEARPEELAKAMGAAEPVTSDPWVPDELVLYRSILRPEGAVYDILAAYPLVV